MLSIIELQDCSTVCKTFERGCNFSITEESVYAVLAPQICTMRNLAKSTMAIIEDTKKTDEPNLVESPNATTLDPSTGTPVEEEDPSFIDKMIEGATNGDQLFGLLGSDCIPCKFRLNFKKEMTVKSFFFDMDSPLFGSMYKFFLESYEQIVAVADMLSGKDQYVDLCQFVRFFKQFMCVPDIHALIAALTALLMKLSIELSSLFDIILQLIGPILMPFLNQVVNQIQQLIDLAIKPLECIVAAISNLMSKLDMNVLFQNLGSINMSIGASSESPSGEKKSPLELDLSGLKDIGNQLDYASATKAGMQKGLLSIKSLIAQLMSYCREAETAIYSIRDLILGDFIKLLTSLTGGSGGTLLSLGKKLAIVQMIVLLKSLVKAYDKGINCGTDEDEELSILPSQRGFTLFKDANGDTVWQQSTDETNKAVELALAGLIEPGKEFDPERVGNETMNKLKSLIKLTGDPVLDSSISRTIETLTTPVKLTFRCSAQTKVADAEKVNNWISELNSI